MTRTQRRTRSSDSQKSVRTFQLVQFKALDDAQGVFEGYLAVFNNEDLGGDIIVPGAFTKTLKELAEKQAHRAELGAPSARYLLPIFWNHDSDCPIGGFTDLREDSIGLYVRAELDMDKEAGRDAYSGLSKGYVPGLSIGYLNTKPPTYKGGVRYLTELRLLEGSATPIPMNEEALALDVKNDQQHSDSAPQSAQTGADAVSRTKPRMHHRSKRSAQTATGADETTAQEQMKARDFATVYTTDRDASDLLEDLDDMWEALRESVVSILIDSGDSSDPAPGVDAAKVDTSLLASSLSQFSAAVTQWASAAALQDCWEAIADTAAERADRYTDYATEPDDGYSYYGYMSRDLRRMRTKAGRVMSAGNHKEMGDALEGLKDGLNAAQAQYKALSDMHGRMSPNADGDDGSDDAKRSSSQDAGDSKSDTRSDATGAGAGLQEGSTTLDLKKVDDLVLSMRTAMLAADMQRFTTQKGVA